MDRSNRGAELFRQWRVDKGWTQHQAAVHLELRERYISRYENGQKPDAPRRTIISKGTDGYVYSEAWDEPANTAGPENQEAACPNK